MMSKIVRSFALIAFIGIIFTSCKKKSEVAKMIPSDALVVGYFDTRSIMDKLPFEEVKSTQMYKDVMADSSLPAWGREFIDDPGKTGIDLDKGMVFFSTKTSGDNFNFVVEGNLKNAADFEKMNQQVEPSQKVADQKGIKMLTMKNNGVVAWNDKNFVYVFSTSTGQKNIENWQQDTAMIPKIPQGDLDQARNYAVRLFSLPSDSTLAKEDHFNSLMNQKGDMKFWLNNEQLFTSMPEMGMLGMLKLDAFIKDSRTAYVVNFEKGEIVMDQKSYYGKEMTNLIKKYKGDNIKSEEFQKIPSNDILGAVAFQFKPEGMKEMLKLMGLDGMANMYGQEIGVTLDDLVGAIDGNMLLSFSDLKVTPKSDSANFGADNVDFNFLFKSGIRDKAKFQKVMDALNKAMGITSATAFEMNDKVFVASNKKSFADAYLAGKSDNKADWMNEVSGQPVGLYVSIQKILASIEPPSDSISNAMLQKSREVWGEVFSKGGDIEDNAFTAKSRVTFIDKNTNSLKILNSYFDQMYQLGKQKKKTDISFSPDSEATPPVDSTVIQAP